MRTHLAAALAASAFLLAAAPAMAAGEIIGLSAAPYPALAGQDVTFTVKGKGACPELFLEFGDGTPDIKMTSVNFDKGINVAAAPHKYAAAKTYAVKAKPGKGCVGQGLMNLVVQSQAGGGGPSVWKGGAAVHQVSAAKILDAIAAVLAPKIKVKLGLVQPGMSFLLLGEDFGRSPGKAEMTGEFGTVKLTVLEWKSKYTHLEVPVSIKGVKDHPSSVVLQTAGGAKSNPLVVSFHATPELLWLKEADIPATAGSNAAKLNSRNWKVVQGAGATIATNEPWTGCVYKASLCGWHQDIATPVTGGTDKYALSLKNGWTLYDFTDFTSGSLYTEKVATTPTGFTEGATSWNPSVTWKLGKGAWATYSGVVWITGPAGVPFK